MEFGNICFFLSKNSKVFERFLNDNYIGKKYEKTIGPINNPNQYDNNKPILRLYLDTINQLTFSFKDNHSIYKTIYNIFFIETCLKNKWYQILIKYVENCDLENKKLIISKILYKKADSWSTVDTVTINWEYFCDLLEYPILFRFFYGDKIGDYMKKIVNSDSNSKYWSEDLILVTLTKLLNTYRDISEPIIKHLGYCVNKLKDIYILTILENDPLIDNYFDDFILHLDGSSNSYLFIKQFPKTFHFIINKINKIIKINVDTIDYTLIILKWFKLCVKNFNEYEITLTYIFDLKNENSFTYPFIKHLSIIDQMKIVFL